MKGASRKRQVEVKTETLTGPALDWAVAKCEEITLFADSISQIVERARTYEKPPCYSTDWAIGGPIIEEDKISVDYDEDRGWSAKTDVIVGVIESTGPTPLIAAMRCFVASVMGDTVEIPEELA